MIISKVSLKPPEERPYRAFITFSNGLDERLYMADWKHNVFRSASSPEKNKFGFVFLKNDFLNGEDLSMMREIWTNFQKKNQDIKLALIDCDDKYQDLDNFNPDDKDSIIYKLGDMFANILNFPGIKDDNKTNIEKPIFTLNKLEDLENITSFLSCNFSRNCFKNERK